MSAGLSLRELWSFVVMHQGALKGFAARNAFSWTRDVRRTAWTGLAVLTSMLRRLIHLMAKDIPLAPICPPDAPVQLPLFAAPDCPRLGFRLTESPRERSRRDQNPGHVPDTPDFDHARFFERLFICAAAYRARFRLARRLARRVQTGRAPLCRLPLPERLYLRTAAGFTNVLDYIDALRAARPDTS